MVPASCPHCGGTNPLDATSCEWCGSPLLPRLPTLERPILPEPEEMEDETSSRETERGLRYFRVGVALVLLIVSITILAANAPTASTSTATSGPPQPNPYASGPVNVTAILAVSSDNACGLNGSQQGGFHTPAHYSYVTFWWLPQHAASLPCTVENVTTNTTGFELSSSLPTTVTANETAIMVDIYTPAAYNGTLYLIFR